LQALSGGKILIHSEKGTSRAPSFAIAYMINNRGKTFKESMNLLGRKIPSVEINDYFKKQLEDYDLGKLAAKVSKGGNNGEMETSPGPKGEANKSSTAN
jgi:Dual specificity phosphatase, catalytic domain